MHDTNYTLFNIQQDASYVIEQPSHGSYRPETFLFKDFSRTFQGQILLFQGLDFLLNSTYM